MSYFGVDLSEYNGNIDWDRLAEHVDFAILRIGWVGNRNDNTLDERFEEYYRSARRAGVKIGAYVYIYSNSEKNAREGAEWAVNRLKGKTIDLPVYCDMEDKSIANLGKSKLTAIVVAFNSIIEKHGYWAGVYANKNWYDNYLDENIRKRYTSWIADYTSGTDKFEGEYDMWQNSSTGRVDGINGYVDTDYMYRNLFRTVSAEDVEPEKPVDEEFAKPVEWKNDHTPEVVYADTAKRMPVGIILPYSTADCFAKIDDMYLVLYDVEGTDVKKCGFVDYHGGIR